MQQKLLQKDQFQKTAEATGDLISTKFADKITSVSTEMHPKFPKELHLKEIYSTKEPNNEIPNEKYLSPEKIRQTIDELRLI